ncbi:MAG TPA: SDR family oxidoreductase [Rhodanobacteraceae bacterium]|nr:SDR family oxidoreductase [Rhodanobacteraceae bacterium]
MHALNTRADSASLAGKTIVITGATGGIGLEAAVELARRSARVVITGRDPARIEAALADIRRRSGSNSVEGLCADFASQAAVRRLAKEILARCPRIDVLVNNAGSVNPTRTLTADGIETTFAVNHLAPFLLTNLLLERIVASAPARIVNVASVAHTRGTLDFADLNFGNGYSIMRAYSRSKLANLLFTRALARRLAGTSVTVNALHPGTVATGIWGHGAPASRVAGMLFNAVFAPIKRFAMLSPERGAQTITYLAASPDVSNKTGLYFEKNRPKEPAPLASDDALAERLWQESTRLTHLDVA